MRVLLTRVATGAATLAVTLGVLAGTTAPASAAGCATAYDSYSTVKAGSTGKQAGSVECLLGKAGYTASQDSAFSKADAKQLKAFQGARTLGKTGKTDSATWAALIAQGSTPALRSGSRGASVRRLQLALRALGHDELPGTTYYGAKTVAAVKALQGQLGQTADGAATAAVWTALQAGGPEATTTDPGSGSSTTPGETALAFATKQLGDKYKYGAAGPDKWDCSGLTMKAWAAAGVELPHSAKAQYKLGTKVAKADLQPGDLVFFYSGPSHVALYVGDGKVIHAPRPGKKVSYIELKYMPWKGARRPG